MTFLPSPYQQRFFSWVRDGRGSCVLTAVAGSGKTTSIIRSLLEIPEGRSVQLLAFNTIIAKELGARVEALRKESGRPLAGIRASTFHSLGFGAVRKYLSNLTIKMDGKKTHGLCDEVMTSEELETYGDYVTALVSLAKGQGIGALTPDLPAAWWDLAKHHDLFLPTETAGEERAIELARQVLARSELAARRGLIDFDDQLYLVAKWKLRLWQNDFVYLDEAQDTNPMRRALAKLALRPGGRLIAVGDARQAIYGFTGASHDAIDLIRAEFSAIELPLTVSYRCARAIVTAAQDVVTHVEAAPDAPEGLVERDVPLTTALTSLTASDAILCRNTAPLISAAYALIARGVGCSVLGREIGAGLVALVKKQRARGVPHLLEKLAIYREREVARFTARGEEGKAEAVTDRVACIETVIEHLAETERTVPRLIERLESLFSDDTGVLTLSTVHRAKGREWERVAILRPDLMPSKWARQEWQQLQEENLQYVAITRAKRHLMFLASEK